VLCWGKQGDVGVLGDGSGTDSQTPRLVAGLIDATSLTLTSLRGCAIRAAGRAVCWGNSYLGGGSTGRSLVPVEVTQSSGTAVEDVVGIAGGDDWVCVVLGSGAVYCWGSSWAASVGLAPTAPLSGTTAVTVSVGGLPPVASISAGRFHVCVTTTQADVYCWGSNSAGAVGNGTKVVQTTPLLIIDSP
jgi:alpha-tubulin suppressor-like RCC1 family protein